MGAVAKAREWVKSATGQQIYGRICSGKVGHPEEPLVGLTCNRATTFVFGEDALPILLDETTTSWSLLQQLGFHDSHIYHDYKNQVPQKLVLFHRKKDANPESLHVVPATWDGVKEFIHHFYPEVYKDYIRLESDLLSTPFSEIEKLAGFPFFPVMKGLDPARKYCNYEEYCKLESPRDLHQLRLFLYCEFRLLELFAGTGYTLLENSPGDHLSEFLMKNKTMEELREVANVFEATLDIEVPPEVLKKLQISGH